MIRRILTIALLGWVLALAIALQPPSPTAPHVTHARALEPTVSNLPTLSVAGR